MNKDNLQICEIPIEKGKIAVFRCTIGNPDYAKQKLDEAINNYCNNPSAYNIYVSKHSDDPYTAILLFGINEIEFKDYNI